MKSLFPQPDETVILDVLTSNDNDIQKTTDALKEMGFQRKEQTKVEKRKPPATPKKVEEKEENKAERATVTKIKSLQEKEKCKFATLIIDYTRLWTSLYSMICNEFV